MGGGIYCVDPAGWRVRGFPTTPERKPCDLSWKAEGPSAGVGAHRPPAAAHRLSSSEGKVDSEQSSEDGWGRQLLCRHSRVAGSWFPHLGEAETLRSVLVAEGLPLA